LHQFNRISTRPTMPLWQIGRPAVDDFEIDRRVTALETRNAVDEVHRTNVGVRLAAIEETLRWLVRLIIGGLLMAGLTYAVQVGLMI
ncbi:MAG: hypothetical protein ACKVIA_13855, partial [Rhodobacterales bacterium]